MINPMLVEGQLHGGIAMGVGQALIENIVYQGDQIVTGSFMDYGMPRADNFCHVRRRRERGADQDQSARRQGRGRVRHGRRAAGGDERGQRRAGAHRRALCAECRRRRRRCGGRSRRRATAADLVVPGASCSTQSLAVQTRDRASCERSPWRSESPSALRAAPHARTGAAIAVSYSAAARPFFALLRRQPISMSVDITSPKVR